MRKLILAVVIVLAAALLPATTASGALKSDYRVTMHLSTTTLAPGGTVIVSGRVAPAAAGATVYLQKNVTGRWVTDGQTRVRRNGTYRLPETPTSTKTRRYRIYKPAGRGYGADYSSARKVTFRSSTQPTQPTQQKADLSITTVGSRTLTAGEYFEVAGKASKNLRGTKVRLQLKSGGKWETLGSAGVTKDNSFAFRLRALRAGRGQVLRVLAPASSRVTAATASAGSFTVFGWYSLHDYFPVVEGSSLYRDSWDINGTTYPKSAAHYGDERGDSPSTQINLSRKCRSFTASVGLDDNSPSDARWSTRLLADSLEVYSRNGLAIGGVEQVTVDVTGALRMTFDDNLTANPGWDDSYLVFGNARLLCAF